jgi:hypothetical protein
MAIGAAVASRNNVTARHPRSITTLPIVRIVVVAEAAVLTGAAVEVRLLPAMAEVAAEAALPATVIAAVNESIRFPQPLRPPDRAGAAFFLWVIRSCNIDNRELKVV